MSVIRVVKNDKFTILADDTLRDECLSLEANDDQDLVKKQRQRLSCVSMHGHSSRR